MKITFLGAAGTVTGSKFLLEADQTRILIDCGLFQGLKELRLRNWDPFPAAPSQMDGVFLTHAHIDHSGFLPKLYRDGYRGRIYTTLATRDLCEILLPDSGAIQEEDARYANRKGFSKHHPALPLYTQAEAEFVLPFFEPLEFGQPMRMGAFEVTAIPSGHILSAASFLIRTQHHTLLFSGDLGRFDDPILGTPLLPREPIDHVVMESTYGDRLHPSLNPEEELKKIVQEMIATKGILMIPAFAVGRTQILLYYFYRLFTREPHLRVPLYINSPMATDVTKIYYRYHQLHRLSDSEMQEMCQMARFVQSVDESKRLNEKGHGPMIIIAASGMLTGGRILHHLKAFAPDARNIILLAGFQAPGTRGHSLLQGATSLKIHGEQVEIQAQVKTLEVFSAHADQADLLKWISLLRPPPKHIHLVHGEPASAQVLAQEITSRLGMDVHIPKHLEEITL